MDNLTVVDHPLLKRDLTILRRKDTPHGAFRKTISDAAAILAYEAMRDLAIDEVAIETPLEETQGYLVRDTIAVVPILRAGLGLVDGFVRFIPEARIGHLGMHRDEATHKPIEYYSKLPDGIEDAVVFVVDPMLATGGSAVSAIHHLKSRGARRFKFVCLVAAPEGVSALSSAHPEIPVITASLDRQLDDNAFIRPGLGDAGDRIFGTE
jgi:uracil phosphoribosyltransferase